MSQVSRARGEECAGCDSHWLSCTTASSDEPSAAAALAEAFAAFARPLSEAPSGETAQAFRARYLSQAHRAAPGEGCPAAALGADVALAAPALRAAFGAGVAQVADGLAGDGGTEARERALRHLSMMVGAMVLARACPDDLAAEILAACAARPA